MIADHPKHYHGACYSFLIVEITFSPERVMKMGNLFLDILENIDKVISRYTSPLV